MFPEYRTDSYSYRRLVMLEKGKLYDREGNMVSKVGEDAELLSSYLFDTNSYCLCDDLSAQTYLIVYFSQERGSTVLADRRGRAIAIRMEKKHSSRWIVTFDTWNMKPCTESLNILEESFRHVGLGTAPTPSSLGRRSMRHVYSILHLPGHTSCSLACESYLLENATGSCSISLMIGETIPVAAELDLSSAFVSIWKNQEMPDKTPEWYSTHRGLDRCNTWFGEVEVQIKRDMPLGVFPVRIGKRRVDYPRTKGKYTTYLWKETCELAIKYGCNVKPLRGWGWHAMTNDNNHWAEWIYEKRVTSPSKEIEGVVKNVAVSGIGSHSRSRYVYSVVSDRKRGKEDIPLNRGRDPVNLWVHCYSDNSSGLQVHWNKYTVHDTNNAVLDFSYNFAYSHKLALIDYDAIFIKETDESEKYRHQSTQPGQWIYKRHHNLRLLRNRMWISDEEPDRYGSLLERIA